MRVAGSNPVRGTTQMKPRDTDSQSWRVYLDRLRALPPAERLRIAAEMSDEVRQIAIDGTARLWYIHTHRDGRMTARTCKGK